MSEIIIVAGPNGAGKTSFARQYLGNPGGAYTFVNADEIARELMLPDISPTQRDLVAARVMLQKIHELTEARASFVIETTLAALSYLPKIENWKRENFRVVLIFLRLPSANAAVDRVRRRVEAGGHGIPEQTVRRRFEMGLKYLERHYKHAVDEWYVWDSLEGDFELTEAWDD